MHRASVSGSTATRLAKLAQWNALPPEQAAQQILACCGSDAWAAALALKRPVFTEEALLALAAEVWESLPPEEWQQAFDSHPRLGEAHAVRATAASLTWSAEEQAQALPTEALRHANRRYEEKFGRVFLFCASGRTTDEILAALHRRMQNDAETEWRVAGDEQRRITGLRLERWLGEDGA
ncbi:MAG TPA: 2-oxo-4-hydroxy-4-carboxy-5-ureidoimidazoline decarboxylase [Acidobacteriaceae bacterium]